MARGRMISKSLSTSEKYAALHEAAGKLAEFCQSLYPLLLAHADDWGCQQGDVFTIKHAVFPTSPRKLAEFDAALVHLHNAKLITLYEADGKRLVYVRGFAAHQNLRGHDSRNRLFPAPPENPSKIAKVAHIRPDAPTCALREENLTEEKRTEEKGTEPNLTALTRTEGGFLAFWTHYPKKKNKPEAEKAWRALSPLLDLQQRILAALASQRGSPEWLKEGGQYIPFPASWLRSRRWEDEATEVPHLSKQTQNLSLASREFLRDAGR